jgi:hypothetical protein
MFMIPTFCFCLTFCKCSSSLISNSCCLLSLCVVLFVQTAADQIAANYHSVVAGKGVLPVNLVDRGRGY